jgi:hypothetical protein
MNQTRKSGKKVLVLFGTRPEVIKLAPMTEFEESFWAEVGYLVLFPVTPQILHRIKLGGVGQKKLKFQATPLLKDKVLN